MKQLNWVEEFRPNTLEDLVLDDDKKKIIQGSLDKGLAQNLLLANSKPGCGKTSLAKIIAEALHATTLYINSSKESGVDTMKTKVQNFVDSVGLNDGLKIVILDEYDYVSINSQAALRGIIEDGREDTRFILTANYLEKVIKPIQSRCVPFNLTFNVKSVVKRMLKILEVKNIKFDSSKHLKPLIELCTNNYPDIRLTIGILEQMCVSGEFDPTIIGDAKVVKDFAEKILTMDDTFMNTRKFWIQNETLFSADYIKLASEIFNLLEEPKNMKTCAEGIFKMSQVLDKEIGFAALILNLKN
jgi:DNA polymerase III delta prime subunit